MPAPRRRHVWLSVLVLIAAIVAVYWPVLGHDFTSWDDQGTLAANPDFNPPTLAKLARYWVSQHMDLYVPITYTVWALVAAVAYQPVGSEDVALNPHLFHALNLFLHIATSIVVYLLLRRFSEHRWAATAGALLYALHPVQVEPVAWVSGTKDLLAGLFVMLALLFYVRQAQRARADASEERNHAIFGRDHAIATLFFILAMFSKPSAVVAPVLAGAIDVLLVRRGFKVACIAAGAWLLLALPVVTIGRSAQYVTYPEGAPWWLRLVVPLDALAFYVRKIAWPIELAPDYDRSHHWLMEQFGRPIIWIMMLMPIGLALLALLVHRRWPRVATGVALFMLAPLPVLGLVPFDFQSISTTSDRYLYLAMLGPALALVAMIDRPPRWWFALPVVVVLALLGWRAHVQSYLWRDTRTLFAHTLNVSPDSVAAHLMLGQWATKEGNLALAERYLNAAMRMAPEDDLTQALYGDLLMASGMPWDAVVSYQKAIDAAPTAPQHLVRAGLARLRMNHPTVARDLFRRALEVRPGYLPAHVNLGNVEMKLNNPREAARHYEAALAISPGHPIGERGLREAREKMK